VDLEWAPEEPVGTVCATGRGAPVWVYPGAPHPERWHYPSASREPIHDPEEAEAWRQLARDYWARVPSFELPRSLMPLIRVRRASPVEATVPAYGRQVVVLIPPGPTRLRTLRLLGELAGACVVEGVELGCELLDLAGVDLEDLELVTQGHPGQVRLILRNKSSRAVSGAVLFLWETEI
jgi:hypothetical protein